MNPNRKHAEATTRRGQQTRATLAAARAAAQAEPRCEAYTSGPKRIHATRDLAVNHLVLRGMLNETSMVYPCTRGCDGWHTSSKPQLATPGAVNALQAFIAS